MDRSPVISQIKEVFDAVVETLHNTDEALFNIVPFEGSWTIGQVAEHIRLCSRGIPDGVTEATGRAANEKAGELYAIFSDMNQKSIADPVVTPGLPPHDKKSLLANLEANKTQLLSIAGEKDLTVCCMDMEFPYMGYLTRYEWLYFVGVHTQRHLNQIAAIKKELEHQRQNESRQAGA